MFEVPLREFRAALASVMPFCGKDEPFDRLRFEIRDETLFISTVTRHAVAVGRVGAQVWDDARGIVFEISAASGKKILAVHTLARTTAEQGSQRVLFEVEDAGTNLRSQDTSGLFPGTEALVVPLEENAARLDVLAVIGARLHGHDEVTSRPGGTQSDGRGVSLSLRLFDTAVKQYKGSTIVRLTEDHRTAIVQVGASFIGLTSTLALPQQDEREPYDSEQPVIRSWPMWLEDLPDTTRDGLRVFGAQDTPDDAESDSDEERASRDVTEEVAAGIRDLLGRNHPGVTVVTAADLDALGDDEESEEP